MVEDKSPNFSTSLVLKTILIHNKILVTRQDGTESGARDVPSNECGTWRIRKPAVKQSYCINGTKFKTQ